MSYSARKENNWGELVKLNTESEYLKRPSSAECMEINSRVNHNVKKYSNKCRSNVAIDHSPKVFTNVP